MKTLFVTDLDGTLLNRKARLSENTCTILNRLIGNGMLFSVATARSQSAFTILNKLNIEIPSIHLNGVLMYDNKNRKYIDCVPMDTETATQIIKILHDFDRMSFVYKFDRDCGINVEFERLSNEVEKNFFEVRKDNDYKSFRQTKNISVSDEDRVIYFTMVDDYSRLLPICRAIEKLPEVKVTLYSDNYTDKYFLEVFSSKATKASGALKLKSMVGADRLVTFGDNLNDLEMLNVSDMGIAVGDAVEEVRKSAGLVIGKSYEDGVALYLESQYSEIRD